MAFCTSGRARQKNTCSVVVILLLLLRRRRCHRILRHGSSSKNGTATIYGPLLPPFPRRSAASGLSDGICVFKANEAPVRSGVGRGVTGALHLFVLIRAP